MNRIAVIPGDGIGPEVVREAVRVLNSYSKRTVDAVAEATGEARVNGR